MTIIINKYKFKIKTRYHNINRIKNWKAKMRNKANNLRENIEINIKIL
jgi:hypothetical protein